MILFGRRPELIHWDVLDFENRLASFKNLMIHHSQTADGKVVDTLAIMKYHIRDKGWDYIGYNLLIERYKGVPRLYYGRFLNMPGAHCRAADMNKLAVGLCVVGNFDLAAPDRELWDFTSKVCAEILRKFKWPKGAIIGHRDYEPSKTCPGNKFDLSALRACIK